MVLLSSTKSRLTSRSEHCLRITVLHPIYVHILPMNRSLALLLPEKYIYASYTGSLYNIPRNDCFLLLDCCCLDALPDRWVEVAPLGLAIV